MEPECRVVVHGVEDSCGMSDAKENDSFNMIQGWWAKYFQKSIRRFYAHTVWDGKGGNEEFRSISRVNTEATESTENTETTLRRGNRIEGYCRIGPVF
jgi:hypothetical protein